MASPILPEMGFYLHKFMDNYKGQINKTTRMIVNYIGQYFCGLYLNLHEDDNHAINTKDDSFFQINFIRHYNVVVYQITLAYF